MYSDGILFFYRGHKQEASWADEPGAYVTSLTRFEESKYQPDLLR
jgi:hypothetical protein